MWGSLDAGLGPIDAGVQLSDFPLPKDSGETGLFSFFLMLFEGMSLREDFTGNCK